MEPTATRFAVTASPKARGSPNTNRRRMISQRFTPEATAFIPAATADPYRRFDELRSTKSSDGSVASAAPTGSSQLLEGRYLICLVTGGCPSTVSVTVTTTGSATFSARIVRAIMSLDGLNCAIESSPIDTEYFHARSL